MNLPPGKSWPVRRSTAVLLLCLTTFAIVLLSGCGGSSQPPTPSPLEANNLNLIFVATEDLSYQAKGDVNLKTGNLTSRGLQRALMMGTFLQQSVLGGSNVNGIYALVPMTHPQTANHYPDMAGLATMEQFAMLNRTTMSIPGASPFTASSYPVNVSYSPATLPDGVQTPLVNCPAMGSSAAYSCQGLDYRDLDGDNEALVGAVIQSNTPGFYVFSAPWETISALMANINRLQGYNLTLPAEYVSPDYVYAIAITPSGSASFVSYDSKINPPPAYPTLPPGGIVPAACLPIATNTTFQVTVTGGVGTAVVPAGVNTNETIYFIRHGEAHPTTVVGGRELLWRGPMARARSS